MKNGQDRRENFGIFMLGAEATFSGSLMRGEHQQLRFLLVPSTAIFSSKEIVSNLTSSLATGN